MLHWSVGYFILKKDCVTFPPHIKTKQNLNRTFSVVVHQVVSTLSARQNMSQLSVHCVSVLVKYNDMKQSWVTSGLRGCLSLFLCVCLLAHLSL